MFHSRSRAAITGATTGAAILLAVPVVALGQVPGVDKVVGGVNQAAQDVVQAAPAPPVRLPAPATAPKPAAPAAPAPAPAASAPSAPVPAAQAPARSATASGSQSSGGTTGAHASGAHSKAGGQSGGVNAHAAGDQAASGPDASASQTDTEIADDPASAPREASPDTLPFTGLQLALLLLAGTAALAAGSVLRRTARP